MPNRETTYTVTVSHPTGYITGEHTVRVKYKAVTAHVAAHRYCDSAVFGCSRDYYHVLDDLGAIRMFLAEHNCAAERIVQEPSPVENWRQVRDDHMVEVRVRGEWYLASDVEFLEPRSTMGRPVCVGELVRTNGT